MCSDLISRPLNELQGQRIKQSHVKMLARCELINWRAGCGYSVLLNSVNNTDSTMYEDRRITPLENAAIRFWIKV